jgi:hypothetical protein
MEYRRLLLISLLTIPTVFYSTAKDSVPASFPEQKSELRAQDTTEFYYVKTKSNTRFFNDMDNMSSVTQMIPKNVEVQVFEPFGDYYSAYFDGSYGFLFISKVDPVNFDPEIFQVKPEVIPTVQDKYTFLVEKYGQKDADQIIARKIWKGMTKDMILDSWGKPRQIDRYIGQSTVKEEWYYQTRVLFVRDGKLVDWK